MTRSQSFYSLSSNIYYRPLAAILLLSALVQTNALKVKVTFFEQNLASEGPNDLPHQTCFYYGQYAYRGHIAIVTKHPENSLLPQVPTNMISKPHFRGGKTEETTGAITYTKYIGQFSLDESEFRPGQKVFYSQYEQDKSPKSFVVPKTKKTDVIEVSLYSHKMWAFVGQSVTGISNKCQAPEFFKSSPSSLATSLQEIEGEDVGTNPDLFNTIRLDSSSETLVDKTDDEDDEGYDTKILPKAVDNALKNGEMTGQFRKEIPTMKEDYGIDLGYTLVVEEDIPDDWEELDAKWQYP